MSGSNVTVIGKITDVSGIVLIYSNGGKGEVRVAKVGEEILSSDVIDDTNGNYKIELANRSIRFLQNEDLSVHDVEQSKNINELLKTPKAEQDEKKKVEEKTITEQKQEEKTTDIPEKKYEQDNNDQKR
jgi:hypothetical protein